jgi:hypothetical protein
MSSNPTPPAARRSLSSAIARGILRSALGRNQTCDNSVWETTAEPQLATKRTGGGCRPSGIRREAVTGNYGPLA